jgi:hypothetical protein
MAEKFLQRKTSSLDSLLLVSLVFISVGILFLPAIGSGYFFLDDHKYVISNPYVALGITWESIYWAFRSLFFGQWHPLTWLSYMIETQLAGFNSDLQRFDNILIHCINGALVYLALSRTGLKKLIVAAVTICFVFGTISAEPANWISCRKDLLSVTFSLLTFLSYLNWRGTDYRTSAFLSVVLFYLCALASKPGVFLLPLILILADYLHNPSSWNYFKLKKIALKLVLLITIAASSVALNIFAHYSNDAIVPTHQSDLFQSFGLVLNKLLVNLWLVLSPWQVVFSYPSDLKINSFSQIIFLLLIGILILAIIFSKKTLPASRAGIFLGLGWFLVFIAPYVGVLQVGIQTFTNRWIYGAQIGLLLVVFITLFELSRLRIKLITTLATLTMLCFLASQLYFGHKQLQAWNDPQLLFKYAEAIYANNTTNYLNKISYQSFKLSQRGQTPELSSSAALFGEILNISPHNYRALRSLLEAYQDKKQLDCTQRLALKVLSSFKDSASKSSLAIKLEAAELLLILNQSTFWKDCFQLQFKESSLDFAKKILFSPEFQAWKIYQKELVLSELFMHESNSIKAKQHLDRAIQLNPYSCKVDRAAASFWFKEGNHPLALSYLKAANACDPTDVKLAELYSKSVFLWGDRSELSKFVATYNNLKQLKAELRTRESK